MTPIITRHAEQRYQQRCPGGPGLEVELRTLRRPTKRQWQRVKARLSRPGERALRRVQVRVTDQDTVVLIAEGAAGRPCVVTCWKLGDRR